MCTSRFVVPRGTRRVESVTRVTSALSTPLPRSHLGGTNHRLTSCRRPSCHFVLLPTGHGPQSHPWGFGCRCPWHWHSGFAPPLRRLSAFWKKATVIAAVTCSMLQVPFTQTPTRRPRFGSDEWTNRFLVRSSGRESGRSGLQRACRDVGNARTQEAARPPLCKRDADRGSVDAASGHACQPPALGDDAE